MIILNNKKKFILNLSLSVFLIAIISNQAIAACSQAFDTPYEFRKVARDIIFDFLSDPVSSSFDKSEIKDMVKFYKDKKREKIFVNCDIQGTNSNKKIKDIVQKKIDKDKLDSKSLEKISDDDGKITNRKDKEKK